MKKVLFLICFWTVAIFPFEEADASHVAGGDIYYEYIGTPSQPYKYCMRLRLYRRNETGSAGLGPTANLSIASSCFATQNIVLNRYIPTGATPTASGDGGVTPRGYEDCVGSQPMLISEHWYENCNVILPGKCSDFRISYSLCCRNAQITNLANTGNFYIEAELNNTLGPNTSPDFLNPAARAFCINQPFLWSQAAFEPDGDSLFYKKGQPLDGPNSFIPWASGFSTAQPMTTNGGFNLDAKTGTFTFTPSTVEIDVLKILVEEYRFDSSFGAWLKIGTAVRELQTPIEAVCNPVQSTGVQVDSNVVGPNGTIAGTAKYSKDSLLRRFAVTKIGNADSSLSGGEYKYKIPVVPYRCFDTLVNIQFENDIQCGSFSPDGTEFRIIGPDSIPRPVIGVTTKCQTTLLTNDVDLHLYKPLDINGDYLLYIKKGTDGNTLKNECGYTVRDFFALILRVEDCPKLSYDMENVSVVNDRDILVEWSADPASFSPQAFSEWWIQRQRVGFDPDFLTVGRPSDPGLRSFLDTTLDTDIVDASQFRYRVQFPRNFSAEPPTRHITSILLEDTLNDAGDGLELEWSVYDGWPAATYELFMGRADSVAGIQWRNYDGPDSLRNGSPFLGSQYAFPPEEVLEDTAGTYAFKVEATRPLRSGWPYTAESNWIYIDITYDPPVDTLKDPEPGFAPNVFTPNGDGVNDLFFVSAKNFTSVEGAVYNRWGRMVFRNDQPKGRAKEKTMFWAGEDMATGQKVADGVYYYIVTLTDEVTGQTEELNGNVTILSGGTR